MKTINSLLASSLDKLPKGLKDNKDKLQMARFYKHFPNAIKGLFEVASFGAKKYKEPYEEINWKKNNKRDYEDALYRHLHEYLIGKTKDDESGLSPLYHLFWNVAVLIELNEKK